MTDLEKHQGKLEQITRKWWFFGLFVLIQFFPPYASKGYNIEDWGKVIQHALGNAIVGQHPEIYPVFQVIAILALIGILVFRNKFARIFGIYVAISYVLFTIGQSVAITDKYGVSICTINFVMFLIVAGFWAWEAVVLKNDYTFRKLPIWRYWVVPLAVLAFWYPSSRGRPDFNPVHLITRGSGLAFCLMTPVYLSLLSLYWPRVNNASYASNESRWAHYRFVQYVRQFWFRPRQTLVEWRSAYSLTRHIHLRLNPFPKTTKG
ncbi:MAG: hypothetical protein ACYS6W_01725 [Planctomycetota bacterium]|jgi:hypothetical protein